MQDISFAPIENPDTEPFWAGCREGRLLIQRCGACGTHRHPPSPICHACLSPEHEWVESSGRGKVWSYAIVREPLERWPGEIPNIVVIVELDERVKIISNLVGTDAEAVNIGMEVELWIDTGQGEMALPKFRATREAVS